MRLTEKQRKSISDNLNAIIQGLFDEKHIKDLPVDIREFVGAKSLTRELAHFIAHYERNSGKYHALFNAREATFDLIVNNPASVNDPVLSIDLIKIHQDLYEAIFVSALHRNHRGNFSEPHEEQLAIADISAYIKSKYIKNGRFYELNDINALSSIHEIAMRLLCRFDGRPLMSQYDLIENLNDEIKHFCKQHFSSLNFGNAIKRRGAEVTLCILSLLQDARFILYNGEEAAFELRCVNNERTKCTNEQLSAGMTRLGIVGRRLTGGMVNRYLESDINPLNTISGIRNMDSSSRLPPVYAKRRADGVLVMFPYDS